MNDWEGSAEAQALRKKDIWMGIFDDEDRAIEEDRKRLMREG